MLVNLEIVKRLLMQSLETNGSLYGKINNFNKIFETKHDLNLQYLCITLSVCLFYGNGNGKQKWIPILVFGIQFRNRIKKLEWQLHENQFYYFKDISFHPFGVWTISTVLLDIYIYDEITSNWRHTYVWGREVFLRSTFWSSQQLVSTSSNLAED